LVRGRSLDHADGKAAEPGVVEPRLKSADSLRPECSYAISKLDSRTRVRGGRLTEKILELAVMPNIRHTHI
jgi:hypothetical protein